MFEIYMSHTGSGEHTTDPRNRFHEVALREARYASEWHGRQLATPTGPSLLARVRTAISGSRAASPETCGCPA